MTRVLVTTDGLGKRQEIARFDLIGEDVHVHYLDDGWKMELERDGIFVSGVGRLKRSDGKRFFDGLPRAFARSSFVWVEDRE